MIIYNVVISGFVRFNCIDKVVDMYYNFVSGGFLFIFCIYGFLIDGFVKFGRLEEVKKFFEEMIEYGC